MCDLNPDPRFSFPQAVSLAEALGLDVDPRHARDGTFEAWELPDPIHVSREACVPDRLWLEYHGGGRVLEDTVADCWRDVVVAACEAADGKLLVVRRLRVEVSEYADCIRVGLRATVSGGSEIATELLALDPSQGGDRDRQLFRVLPEQTELEVLITNTREPYSFADVPPDPNDAGYAVVNVDLCAWQFCATRMRTALESHFKTPVAAGDSEGSPDLLSSDTEPAPDPADQATGAEPALDPADQATGAEPALIVTIEEGDVLGLGGAELWFNDRSPNKGSRFLKLDGRRSSRETRFFLRLALDLEGTAVMTEKQVRSNLKQAFENAEADLAIVLDDAGSGWRLEPPVAVPKELRDQLKAFLVKAEKEAARRATAHEQAARRRGTRG